MRGKPPPFGTACNHSTGLRRATDGSLTRWYSLSIQISPPRASAAGELHPLVVQSFVGAGPVLFLGFDDTWRWRFRNDEEHFDRFWVQAVRVLSRSRFAESS